MVVILAVEYGFLSTTTSMNIAFQYSGLKKNRGMVFEITAGRIDIGASIQASAHTKVVTNDRSYSPSFPKIIPKFADRYCSKKYWLS